MCVKPPHRPWFFYKLSLLSLGFLSVSVISSSALSQTIPLPPILNPTLPNPTQPQIPQPLVPQEEPLPISPPAPTPSQPKVDDISRKIFVLRFDFKGNTEAIFSQQRLREEVKEFNHGSPITFPQLLQAASKITNLYIKERYVTSGAYIPEQTLTGGVVKIQIVEGSLQEIRVLRELMGSKMSPKRLDDSYVLSRLSLATGKPLNIRRLQEALRLLRLDPLIEKVSAELSAGTTPGKNLLTVTIKEADSFSTRIIADNSRNPSVGTFRRGFEIEQANLTGSGDDLRIAYDNTDGSNTVDARYSIPINPHDGTISFRYSNAWSHIIEPPFDQLDITSNSRDYEITLRQPVVRTFNEKFFQEGAIGFTLSRRESDSSVLGVDFPIFLGADTRGNTRISALRFFQEWKKLSNQQVFVARSQFSLGVGAFDATINNQAPDSRFFTWRGQLSWLRLLSSQTSHQRVAPRLLLRSDVQLASRALVPLEQFTLGGIFSVRGYRQDLIFSDNGIFVSADLQLPIYSTENGENVLQLIPFVDVGTAWNNSGKNALDPNTLAAIGLGLQWEMSNRFKARLDYGIPLVDINSRERTWQEKGFYFSLRYSPF